MESKAGIINACGSRHGSAHRQLLKNRPFLLYCPCLGWVFAYLISASLTVLHYEKYPNAAVHCRRREPPKYIILGSRKNKGEAAIFNPNGILSFFFWNTLAAVRQKSTRNEQVEPPWRILLALNFTGARMLPQLVFLFLLISSRTVLTSPAWQDARWCPIRSHLLIVLQTAV